MSFNLFLYYSAIVGGWAALVGWLLGRLMPASDEILKAGLRGMCLGMVLALALGLVDAVGFLSWRRWGQVALRIGTAMGMGLLGGLLGGMLGQILYSATGFFLFFVLGWVLTGLLIGASLGIFELVQSAVRRESVRGSSRKLLKGLLGGAAGGFLGGVLALLLRLLWNRVFSGKDPDALLSPSSWGFIVLGMCIGLLIGLAQVIFKEAWIKVEEGFRPGREIILVKEKTSIGRAEGCDLGLFGDNSIEKFHARILQAGNRYFLEDANTPAGTYVNDARLDSRHPLHSGDLIRVGQSLLRFFEREKN